MAATMRTTAMTKTVARPAPDLDDDQAVRARLSQAVRNFEIIDLAVPMVANAWVLAILFLAWGWAKDVWSAGDYFLLPSLISLIGLALAQVAMGAWWFNRHKWNGRVLVAEEDAVVTQGRVAWTRTRRTGAPVPLGPPYKVLVGVVLGDERVLAFEVQAHLFRGGVATGRTGQRVALLGVAAEGTWLLGIDESGEILWPTSPAILVQARSA
ncbi:MAG TPA: hypothetical protein VE152_00825 [Acidimicrobiales bacterium]|jgi:hypothetical protein|nr:hypothetical protein [Acidimicrobiales bacterium]